MAFLLPNLSPSFLLPTGKSFKEKPISNQTVPSSSSSSSNSYEFEEDTLSPLSLFSVQAPPPVRGAQVKTKPSAQDKYQHGKDDFYINLGLAVRTLREDLPLLFTKDLNYDIYRDDITFVDPMNTFSGIDKYKLIFWALRFHGKILFRDISLEIFRVWQPSENMILIRWNLKGVPRVPWEAKGEFQGTSRYKLDRNGKIYEHKVDNLAFNFPHQLKPATSVLDLVTACPASPNPTFMFGAMDSYSSSWIEFYKAVQRTLDKQEEQMLVQDHFVACS
ncbi:NTF2-like domain superfamily [Arabidopsis thaliana x Arabidopsis arenosa]|uniref:NTF2-like domain superfamily n=1 Tax=Arabidopsis thaliana x Arabidopsis arenosa TaxID=1240361 RepID=A0A8T2GYL8_9BRAS|nr:NTF2-like domain superfamily [Arabidopsis thaliana x Arabidopsis arenosa]